MIWHRESTAAVVSQLGTDRESGLSQNEAAARLRTAGENRPESSEARSFGGLLLTCWRRPTMLLLWAVTLLALIISVARELTGGTGDWVSPVAVLVLSLILPTAQVAQEWMALRRLNARERQDAPRVSVWRDGARMPIPATDLVPGDVVELTAGDVVPADARLLESRELRCDEGALTGELLPVQKDAAAAVSSIAPLGQRANMVYGGSAVVHGHARAVVVETGRATERGKQLLLEKNVCALPLPLQNKLTALSRAMLPAGLFLGLVVLVAGWLCGMTVWPLLLTVLSLTALLPVGLTALSVMGLSRGVQRMARRGIAVRRLSAVEKLAAVTVLCTDKTGSLTQNEMTLTQAFVCDQVIRLDDNPMPPEVASLIQLATLCTDSPVKETTQGDETQGDPTETAIVTYALHHGVEREQLTADYPRLGEIPFDSARRRMTAVHLIEGRNVVIVKGAPEALLDRCESVPDEAREAEDFMEAGAQRVLALAYKYVDEAPTHCFADELEQGLTFLGLLGLTDPPRDEARAAVASCRAAGLHTVMITGENRATASALAQRLGLLSDRSQAVTGEELAAMSDGELSDSVSRYRVCARVAPQDKLRLIGAWQKTGACVAVTGDAASDAAVLKTADVGCAMDRTGTDVAKAAADVVLTDDRFSTMVDALCEGRAVTVNIARAVKSVLTGSLTLFAAMLLALIVCGQPVAVPAAIWWLALSAGLWIPAALVAEPPARGILKQSGGLSGKSAALVFAQGLLCGAATLAAFLYGGATGAYLALSLLMPVELLAVRSARPLVKSGLLRAPLSMAAAIGSAVAALLPLWITPLGVVCGLTAPTGAQWTTGCVLAAAILGINEVYKLTTAFLRKGRAS